MTVAAMTATATVPARRLSTFRPERTVAGLKSANCWGNGCALISLRKDRNRRSRRESTSGISKLLSQGCKPTCHVGTDRSRATAHQSGALVVGVARAIGERDPRALFERKPAIAAIHIDDLSAWTRVAGRTGQFGHLEQW